MGSALHCLIIDDQPESIAGLAGQLEDRGHHVTISADSIESLRLLAEAQNARTPYSLLLVDVNLPGMDGPSLVREIRRRGDQTPVLFITGYHSVTTRLRSELAGMRVLNILIKPVPIAEIDRCLEFILRQARSSTQDRRSSEFGLGSGGHPLVGQITNVVLDPDAPFYGTARTLRVPTSTTPTEGALARVQRPPTDNDIIPDTVVTGRYKTPPPEPMGTSGMRRSVQTPLPFSLSDTSRSAGQGGRLPSGQPSSAPPTGSAENTRRYLEFTPLGTPMVGIRDPITGAYKRRPSGHFPPDLQALEPSKPAAPPADPSRPVTSSRYRRSLTPEPPASQQPRLDDSVRQPSGSHTSIIRRGLSKAPAAPECPPCMVACAHCQGHFSVPVKIESYTAVCVHCGQLNRIDPL